MQMNHSQQNVHLTVAIFWISLFPGIVVNTISGEDEELSNSSKFTCSATKTCALPRRLANGSSAAPRISAIAGMNELNQARHGSLPECLGEAGRCCKPLLTRSIDRRAGDADRPDQGEPGNSP